MSYQERDCDICGVEITDNALAVNEHPFRRSTAFLLGNEVPIFAMPVLSSSQLLFFFLFYFSGKILARIVK